MRSETSLTCIIRALNYLITMDEDYRANATWERCLENGHSKECELLKLVYAQVVNFNLSTA